tara:strand:- start:1862 stop:2941 length:1080 start_codon:yes stop_codon:yes gene_type:complete
MNLLSSISGNLKFSILVFFLLLINSSCSDSEDKPFIEEKETEEIIEVKNHFTVAPFDLDKIARISPVGSNNKILPVAHTYWFTCDDKLIYPSGNPCNEEKMTILSPGDGVIRSISSNEDGNISFTVNPSFQWGFSHITVDSKWKEGDSIKAGEVVGVMFSENNIDFGVYNTFVDNSDQFARKDRYPELLLHSQHPIEQFVEPLRSQLTQKLPGPMKLMGKVGYDKAQTAAGGWFLQSGPSDKEVFVVEYVHNQLYLGRLTVNPDTRLVLVGVLFEKDGVSPTFMSVGSDEMQWEEISTASGMIQIKLYHPYINTLEPNTNYLTGSLLIQMHDDETLEIEWFPSHDPIDAFTESSRTYLR